MSLRQGRKGAVKRFEWLIKGGRLVDPAADLDANRDVGIAGGRVVAVAPELPASEAEAVWDATGKLVVPGLIDLHTHVYWGGTSLGVEAEPIARRSGTTTFVDAGSAGPGNYAGFQRFIADASPLRFFAFLNVSFAGIFGFSERVMAPECEDLRLLNAEECVEVARKFPESIVGIKVRVGRNAGGNAGLAPLLVALEVAEELGLPVMTHIDFPPPGREEILELLRPGDLLTHCFRPFPNSLVSPQGTARDSVRKARERGVLFDVGHGMGALSFEVAQQMLADGFAPDTVSSDAHVLSVNGPAFDVLVTVSKFLCMGLPLLEALRRVTATPASVLRRPDLGTLQEGAHADVALLALEEGRFVYQDVKGQEMTGSQRLTLQQIFLAGTPWPEEP